VVGNRRGRTAGPSLEPTSVEGSGERRSKATSGDRTEMIRPTNHEEKKTPCPPKLPTDKPHDLARENHIVHDRQPPKPTERAMGPRTTSVAQIPLEHPPVVLGAPGQKP